MLPNHLGGLKNDLQHDMSQQLPKIHGDSFHNKKSLHRDASI